MSMPQPPVAERRPIVREHHGEVFEDPYEWMRDKTSPEVIAHLQAENAYTEQVTAHLEALRTEVYDSIVARTQLTDVSVPEYCTHTSGQAYWYYTRTVEGQQYPIWCRVPATDRDHRPDPSSAVEGEQVLLDGNIEAEGHEFFSLGAFSVSPDGSMLAYSVDNAGDERFDVSLRVFAQDRTFGPFLTGVGHGIAWVGDERLVYTRVDEAWRPHEVWMHELQSDPATDRLVFSEPDERYWLGAVESRDRRWIVIADGSKLTAEWWLLPIDQPQADPRPVARRTEGLDYEVEVGDGEVFILHNANSDDFQVSRAPLDWEREGDELAPRESWRDFAGPSDGVRYTGVDAYRGHVVVSRRRDGLAGIEVHDLAAAGPQGVRPVVFDDPVHEAEAVSGDDVDTDRVRIRYTSLRTPASVLEYHFDSADLETLKVTPVLDHPVHGPYRREDYVEERQWATAGDGTLVPLSIIRRADVPLDGSSPCLLYGYGSYEICIPPTFSIPRLSLLDHGFTYVIAHIRGGGEMGRAWYDQGKTLAKKNTFTDFVDAARWLVDHGYTSPDRLVAEGRSAGGLLVGAATNLAPELFRAVHAGVAFVDCLTTVLDPSLPLVVTEWEEWGDPLHDPEVYRYMASYAPYENIAAVRYPAILATTGLNDTRVEVVEPTKWVQQLRHTTVADPDRPVLQRTEMVAGHAGVTGRYEKWRELAFELAWTIDQGTAHHLTHDDAD
ncbi:S9 family peptidase [Aestuariimicrobium ganziense]|uniref:S9 family peptidase n=1 Tax=Aestuariimicrobium ganziense TaxID=2773677 RepID=UPI001942A515|nr:S9 family peptidase [Aestuariimicrobium ganziense]